MGREHRDPALTLPSWAAVQSRPDRPSHPREPGRTRRDGKALSGSPPEPASDHGERAGRAGAPTERAVSPPSPPRGRDRPAASRPSPTPRLP